MFPFPLGQEKFTVSGKALAAGFSRFNAPAASALPLSYFSNDAKNVS